MAANHTLGRRTALAFATLPVLLARPAKAADKLLVMTSLQATYSIARALTRDTAIDVHAAFPADTSMDEQSGYLAKKRRPDFLASAKRADAVITIRRIWDLDPLFPAVRAQDIRAIEIDASTPFAQEMAGVALLETRSAEAPADGRPKSASPYIWLNLTNVVRMTDIIAADLRRLSEADATTIDRNQKAFRGAVLKLRAAFDAKIAELDNPSVMLLNPDLAYLLSDIGVDIAARFSKSDYDWNDADLKALLEKMASSGTRVVVTARKPKDAIASAIAAAGGRVALLDLMDPGLADADGQLDPDGLMKVSQGNLERLFAALQA
jgi:ABC-type Zn uptake system ZnuABC Zn-binding protein ZnuA